MEITVRVFGEISQAIGNRHIIDLEEGADIKALTNRIAEKTRQKRRGYFGEYKVGGKELGILLNGKNIELLKGLRTLLKNGDEVVLLIYTMGG